MEFELNETYYIYIIKCHQVKQVKFYINYLISKNYPVSNYLHYCINGGDWYQKVEELYWSHKLQKWKSRNSERPYFTDAKMKRVLTTNEIFNLKIYQENEQTGN